QPNGNRVLMVHHCAPTPLDQPNPKGRPHPRMVCPRFLSGVHDVRPFSDSLKIATIPISSDDSVRETSFRGKGKHYARLLLWSDHTLHRYAPGRYFSAHRASGGASSVCFRRGTCPCAEDPLGRTGSSGHLD